MTEGSPVHVLLVEDREDDVLLVVTHLRRGGIELTYDWVQSARAVSDALAVRPPEIVICDYNMPGFSAHDALAVLRDSELDVPFIVVSGEVGEETAAALMKAGAHDFILKDRLSRLVPAVQRELREAGARQQRRKAEAALRDSEEHFRLLAEHAQDIIFRYRVLPRAELEYVSPAVTAITGYRPEELYADPLLVFSMVEPEHRAEFSESWRSPKQPALVVRWRRRDGRLIWIEQRAVGIDDDAGEFVAVEGILRDITAQVLAEQEREGLDQQLRQSERLDSLGRLAGGIAHDFNNLLAVIMNYADDVAGALPSSHPCRLDVEKISQAAVRAAALTRQLLIFSRLEPSRPETLDLNVVVTEIEHLLRRTIGEDIEFVTTLQPGLHPVTIDRSKIEQVIVNLVMNARAAMPEGGRLCIETSELDPGAQGNPDTSAGSQPFVCLSVADNGLGMTADVTQRAFEPFFTTKGPGEGSGLGLATAYGVAKDAGGDISLRSVPGKGATVTAFLPAAERAMLTTSVARTDAPHGTGQSILVVEDDEAVREIVVRMLSKNGYTMVAATNPHEALERCRNPQLHIDALLTDVIMPEMSGLQLVERVRHIRPDLPILLMSGYIAGSMPGAQQLASNLPLIRKPFTAATLLQGLQNLLERR